MQVELLKSIVSSFAGQSSEGIVDLLFNKKNVNEFLIAKNLELTINQTRNILYKLADEGLVSFIRKKDKKKGGWYTYFWTLNSGKSLLKFRDKLVVDIENLTNQLDSRKSKTFFYCKNCEIEYNEENALLHEYTCPECGEILEVRESGEIVSHLESELVKLKELLGQVNVEVEEVEKKEGRARSRRRRAEAKEKENERLKRKRKREREAKKAGKGKKEKSKKKVVKKKPGNKSVRKKKAGKGSKKKKVIKGNKKGRK
jgi:transcription initiation factor TFIIE subunit alpha